MNLPTLVTGVFDQVFCLKLEFIYLLYIAISYVLNCRQHKDIYQKINLASGLQMTENIKEVVKG
jgi:hypothetical protein